MKTSHDRDRRCCSLAVEGPDEPVLQYRGVALGWGRTGMGSYLIDSWEVIGTLKEGAPQELEPVPRPTPHLPQPPFCHELGSYVYHMFPPPYSAPPLPSGNTAKRPQAETSESLRQNKPSSFQLALSGIWPQG